MAAGDLAGYRLTPRAETDLEEIWLYSVETRSRSQADRYLEAVLAATDTLVAMPTMARERPEFDPPVRIHPVAEHLIVYHVEDNWLVIIRVLGSRQNWNTILGVIDS